MKRITNADFKQAKKIRNLLMSDNVKVLERLYRRQRFGIKPGLDVIQFLLARLGNPERSFGAIHVAGTNGKGSVCAMIDSVLRCAGYRVGLYTSPHLVRFNERICVNGRQIEDEELSDVIEKVEKAASETLSEKGREPTFFECATAMAFEYFRQKGVKLAVVEVGMGGRLDATNVVMPLVSVITRVSLEHTVYLGSDIESIASEKAGIIKAGRPVVCGATEDAAMSVMQRIARERKSPMFEAEKSVSVGVVSEDLSGTKTTVETSDASYGTIRIPLLGRYQIENLATVIAAIDVLRDAVKLEIDEDTVKKGIEGAIWPARFQVLGKNPLVILDSAHNPGAAEVLVETLKRVLKNKPIGLIAGMCNDKDVHGFMKAFGSTVRNLWVVPLKSERNMGTDQIAGVGRSMGWDVKETVVDKAIDEATKWAEEAGGVVCIAGSIFLAGEVLEMPRWGKLGIKK